MRHPTSNESGRRSTRSGGGGYFVHPCLLPEFRDYRVSYSMRDVSTTNTRNRGCHPPQNTPQSTRKEAAFLSPPAPWTGGGVRPFGQRPRRLQGLVRRSTRNALVGEGRCWGTKAR